jgi:hypothetical protein
MPIPETHIPKKLSDFLDQDMRQKGCAIDQNTICFIVVLCRPGGLRRSDQTRSHPELGRQTLQRQWYYVSRPGRVGRRQACNAQQAIFTDTHNQKSLELKPDRPALHGVGFFAFWAVPLAGFLYRDRAGRRCFRA